MRPALQVGSHCSTRVRDATSCKLSAQICCLTAAWTCSSVWSPVGPATTVCADSSCKPQQTNIAGKLLVLSVGSMEYTHGGYNAAGSNPADCCSKCRSTDGCNAWVFCNRQAGCGSKGSCTVYIKSLNSSSSTSSDAVFTVLPFPGFGTFGASCNADGTWPNHMCSLKQVLDVGKVAAYSQGGCWCWLLLDCNGGKAHTGDAQGLSACWR